MYSNTKLHKYKNFSGSPPKIRGRIIDSVFALRNRPIHMAKFQRNSREMKRPGQDTGFIQTGLQNNCEDRDEI